MSRHTRRGLSHVAAMAFIGFVIAFVVSPPATLSSPALAASTNYYSGTLAPNVKASSGTKSSITGGRSNFYIVNHYYNIRTENISGNIYQTTTTLGGVAEMNHARVYSYFSLCWWTPISSGSWSSLNANCLYYY